VGKLFLRTVLRTASSAYRSRPRFYASGGYDPCCRFISTKGARRLWCQRRGRRGLLLPPVFCVSHGLFFRLREHDATPSHLVTWRGGTVLHRLAADVVCLLSHRLPARSRGAYRDPRGGKPRLF